MRTRVKTGIAGVYAAFCILSGAETLTVKENAVVYQSDSGTAVPVSGMLRATRDPAGFGEKIYLLFDASCLSGTVSRVESLSGYALGLKYPRGSEVYLIKDAGQWSESTITWENAPGNDTASGAGLNPSQSIRLGEFSPVVVPTGESLEMLWSSEDARQVLADALNAGDRVATLVILRPSTREVLYASDKNTDFGAHPFRMNVRVK